MIPPFLFKSGDLYPADRKTKVPYEIKDGTFESHKGKFRFIYRKKNLSPTQRPLGSDI